LNAYLEFLLPDAKEKSEGVVTRHERTKHVLLLMNHRQLLHPAFSEWQWQCKTR